MYMVAGLKAAAADVFSRGGTLHPKLCFIFIAWPGKVYASPWHELPLRMTALLEEIATRHEASLRKMR